MIKLTAKKREVFGKALTIARQAGQLPAVVYGAGSESLSLFVDAKEFKQVLAEAGESGVVVLETESGGKNTLIHEVAHAPLSGEPIHADFLIVDVDKPIRVHIPLDFEGVAPAVKELGGTLVKVLHELEVEGRPNDLPHNIVVDIAALSTMDSQILVKDLKLPFDVTAISGGDEVVASMAEVKEEPAEEVAAPDLASIEVERKGKEEEEEKKEEEEGKE